MKRLLFMLCSLPLFAGAQMRWADTVLSFSSQTCCGWEVHQVLGVPNVYPSCGDIAGAWTHSGPDNGREWIELAFQNPAPINTINIFENNGAGAVDTVYYWNPNTNAWVQVYSAVAAAAPCRILKISFPLTGFNVNRIRISLDAMVPGWNEYDAVGIGTIDNGGLINGNQLYCSGSPSLLNSFDNGLAGGTYQWQDSVAAGTWINISGANNMTYQPTTITQTTYYRRKNTVSGTDYFSNTITITYNIQGDPSVFPVNQWNVYAYNGRDYNLNPGNVQYRGYYSATGVDHNTADYWCTNCAPSSAVNYQGCSVNVDNQTWVMKRQGFPTGTYVLNIPTHDDEMKVYVNGVVVFDHPGCCDGHNNISLGELNASSTIEIRTADGCCGAQTVANFVISPVQGGSINGSSVLCGTGTATFNSTADAYGGYLPHAYQWQDSMISGTWANISGATSNNYTTGTISQNTWYRRKVADAQNNIAYSNEQNVSITLTAGNPSDTGINQWNVYAYQGMDLNLGGSIQYKGYYTDANMNINSQALWCGSCSPSYYSGYQGCPVYADNFTTVYRRKGFPTGNYVISYLSSDDGIYVFKDGVLVYNNPGCCYTTSVNIGYLDANSVLEFRVVEGGGGAYLTATFQLQDCTGQPTGGTAIAGFATVCDTAAATTINLSGATATGLQLALQWQKRTHGSFAWDNIPGANGYSVNDTPTVSMDYRAYIVCNGSALADTSTVATVSVNDCHPCIKIPKKPGGITQSGGASKVCPGEIRTHTIVAIVGAARYNWVVPAGSILLRGQGTNSVQVLYTGAFTATSPIKVDAQNACGTSLQNMRNVIYGTKPPPPGAMTGAKIGVCGALGMPYAVPLKPDLSYNWFFDSLNTANNAAAITSGQGTNSVVIDFTNNWVSGIINVTATNGCGTSNVKKLSPVKPVPDKIASVTGSTSGCIGGVNTYSISPATGASYYIWTGPKGSSISDGVNTATSTSTTSPLLNTTSTTVNVTFSTKGGPVKATAYNACGAGGYKNLTVTVTNCSSPRMVAAQVATATIQIFPNPAQDVMNIMFSAEREEEYTIKVYDALGKEVLSQNGNASEGANQATLNVSNLAAGVYQLLIESNTNPGNMNYKARFVVE